MRIIDYALLMNELLARMREDLPEALRLLRDMVMMESPSFEKPLVDEFVRFLEERFAAN